MSPPPGSGTVYCKLPTSCETHTNGHTTKHRAADMNEMYSIFNVLKVCSRHRCTVSEKILTGTYARSWRKGERSVCVA